MPKQRSDMTGLQFGELTVLSFDKKVGRSQYRWRCRCSCGNESIVDGGNLRRGSIKSCGCKKLLHGHTQYGRQSSPTYQSWMAMKQRVFRPTNRQRKYTGISICPQWMSFPTFLADMGERPRGKTLDRIDNSRGYEPGNCRWATPKQQSANRGPGNYPRGENHHRAKLTEAKVKAIRSDIRSVAVIASDYDVDEKTIRDIRDRKAWAHVP